MEQIIGLPVSQFLAHKASIRKSGTLVVKKKLKIWKFIAITYPVSERRGVLTQRGQASGGDFRNVIRSQIALLIVVALR